MRCIMEMDRSRPTPRLRLYIHDAPHRRQHVQTIQRYRAVLVDGARAADIKIPIDYPLELSALFVNPCSPDLDNLIAALWRALDGKTLRPPAVLTDDRLIVFIRDIGTYFPWTR